MLKLENISFETAGRKILSGINLSVDGRFVAITGPNGSGKSTLLKVIMGLVAPTTGRMLMDGEDITGLSVTDRANRGISFAFQQPVRFKGLKVRDLLELAKHSPCGSKETSGQACSGTGGASKFLHACEILGEVGLCARDYLNRELDDTLSGGEMKRIEIAMAAARGTRLTLFDEPEAGIDLWSFHNLIKVFEKLHEETSGTIMIISHQERILNIANKIVYIKDGTVAEYGSGKDVMHRLELDVSKVPCAVASLKNCGCGREVK